MDKQEKNSVEGLPLPDSKPPYKVTANKIVGC